MEYRHPKEYKGVRNQGRTRLMVEENCMKCSEFMGQEHDFSECDLTGRHCPQPFKTPSLINSKDMTKCPISDKEEK